MRYGDLDDIVPFRGRRPTHVAFAENFNRDGTPRLSRIGVGYAHIDGGGIQILLDSVPLDGAISLRLAGRDASHKKGLN